MRAIKAHELQAVRDNRNQWRIAATDLDAWLLHTVRNTPNPHTLHPPEALEITALKVENSHLRERLADAHHARDQAESDRDRWLEIAGKLADQPRSWWPWRKRK